jgi:poly(glycerol-phosphate) alpha-glucosyltransferase
MRVNVLGLQDEYSDADLASWLPLHVKAFATWGPRQFGYASQLKQALAEGDEDILHTHGIWQYPSVVAKGWHCETGRPYLVSPHGMLDPWALRNAAWKKRIAYWAYEGEHLRQAACLRALCESEARSMRAYGLRNPICVIPNGIDLPAARGQRSEVGGQLSVASGLKTDGRKTLLYLGRIHPKKGLVNLLKAWAAVQRTEDGGQRPEEWVLVIAGWEEGGHEVELKRLATELGIPWADVRADKAESRTPTSVLGSPASVLFRGPQFGDDKAACYQACDAFILPSFSEGLPMVILEAWAYAKPVLMTPQCNLPAGFAAGAALRLEPSAESIAQAIEELLCTPHSALRNMGENGRKLVLDRFTWARVASEMKAVYDWVLGAGPMPACVLTI